MGSSKGSQKHIVVLFVDDDEDLRATMRELSPLIGAERYVDAASLDDVRGQRAAALDCSIAILDLNLGAAKPSGIEVYKWLKQSHFAGKIVFLTGYGAADPRVKEASTYPVPRLTKPIGVPELAALLEDSR